MALLVHIAIINYVYLHFLIAPSLCPHHFLIEHWSLYWWTLFILNDYLFILRERESTEGHRERERENPMQAPYCQLRAPGGSRTPELRDHDLS